MYSRTGVYNEVDPGILAELPESRYRYYHRRPKRKPPLKSMTKD